MRIFSWINVISGSEIVSILSSKAHCALKSPLPTKIIWIGGNIGHTLMKTDFQSSCTCRKTTPKSMKKREKFITIFLTFWHMCERRYWLSHHALAQSTGGGSQLSSRVNWQSFDTSWCHTMRMFATRLGVPKLGYYHFFFLASSNLVRKERKNPSSDRVVEVSDKWVLHS